ncbi:MAG: MazG nucleotide pyrophosphohydrolase domain-containing protein, partial [Acidimicrobiales bacterium]
RGRGPAASAGPRKCCMDDPSTPLARADWLSAPVVETVGLGPVVEIVGLGPAGVDLMTVAAAEALRRAVDTGTPVYLRTSRHPAAAELLAVGAAGREPQTFDDRYSSEASFEAVYESIVASLLEVARAQGRALYCVPGSPLVAERTVELLRARAPGCGVHLEVRPALSFCDLAWARLGLDPIAAGVRLVDGASFASSAAGDHGPLLVAQCWSNSVLSDVKLSIEDPAADQRATVLHHLGLEDETVLEVAWEEIDRCVAADHLTSVYVGHLAEPVAADLVGLAETVSFLRLKCPWDREQTHRSLVRHMLEESYEAIEALEALGEDPAQASPERVEHAEEELGDLLCQIMFHATLGREEGLFELADIARSVNRKLIRRHPHVFGDAVATTALDVVTNWELSKRQEKGRKHLLDGVPVAMPSLARAATIERKLASVGLGWNAAPGEAGTGGTDEGTGGGADEGEAIVALARAFAAAGGDPEGAARRALDRLVARVRDLEI